MTAGSPARDRHSDATSESPHMGKAQGLQGSAWNFLSRGGTRAWILIASLLVVLITTREIVSSLQKSGTRTKDQLPQALRVFPRGHMRQQLAITRLQHSPVLSPRIQELQKLQVAAVVFFGRRRNVKILNTYLERNLVFAGGVLHEVIFIVKTEDKDDLAYLAQLLREHPGVYRQVVPPSVEGENRWARNYEGLDEGRLYIKIDDDIVFIQDGAIPALVEAKLKSKYLFLSANVVNHPLLSHVHARLGAILPFEPLADLSRYCTSANLTECENSGRPAKCRGADCDWRIRKEDPDTLDGTLVGNDSYASPTTCFLWDWRCAAIAHHSFLYHVRRGNLEAYDFPSWDFSYASFDRWSINFFIFNSSDIPPSPLPTDDEVFLGQHLPAARHKHCGAIGQGTVVVHFGYYPQTDQLLRFTRLLSEYEKVAEDMSRSHSAPSDDTFH